MKSHLGVIVASEAAVGVACAGLLYTKVMVLVFLVQSVTRIAGLF